MDSAGSSVWLLRSQLTCHSFFLLTSEFASVVAHVSSDNSHAFFGQVTQGFFGVSSVSRFGLFGWASFWFTELVIHSVFVLALP